MKEFRIGQRVRVVKTHQHAALRGCVGTIISGLHQSCGQMVQDVDLDGVPPPLFPWCGRPEQFEPIDDNTGDWRVIEHVTKWNPTKVNA